MVAQAAPPASKPAHRALQWITVIAALEAFLAVLYLCLVPSLPESWKKVKRGMTEQEVRDAVPHLRSGRGGGAWAVSSDDPYKYWILSVHFEDDAAGEARVTSVQFTFEYQPSWDWLGRPLIEFTRNQ